MNAEAWGRLEMLFSEAMELSGPERSAFLETTRRSEPDLAEKVERLVAAEEASPRFLESAIEAGAAAVSRHLIDSRVGRRIGPWRLTQVLGQGGTSTVYLARRDDGQYDAAAAIKLLLPGAGPRDLLGRLSRECRILARLEHPSIARLLDSGVDESGQPYVVMEYVEGLSIVEHCRRRDLPGSGRLELFMRVCAAVDHAHRHLVVHRDLKPGNVLVTAEGVPKLLDFGIAKILKEPLDGDVVERTISPLRMLTPGYASPEQIRGEAMTTATDIYSLGVILYELLAGVRPIDLPPDLTAAEIERRVCGEEPVPPSAVPGLPPRISRWLRGDLDTIVLKTLRKEPARRYASVSELAADIDRFIKGLPVGARPESLPYVASKFLRRHRTGVAVALTVASIAAASTLAVFVQASKARAERDRAERIVSMLVGMFEMAGPGSGGDLKVRDLLDRGTAQVTALAGEPETQVTLMQTLADLYEKSGDFQRAAELYGRILEIHRATTRDDRAIAASLHNLGRALARGGAYERAEGLFRESLAMRRNIGAGRNLETASTLNALGLVLHELGRFDEAEAHYDEALDLDLELRGPDDAHATQVRGNLALLLYDTGQPARAETVYRVVLDTIEKRRAEGDEEQAMEIRDGLGLALMAQARYNEAARTLERALSDRRRVFGPDHYLYARSLNHFGLACLGLNDKVRAAAPIQEALSMRGRLLGENHMEFGESLFASGLLAAAEGDLVEAEILLTRAVDTYGSALTRSHPFVGEALIERGRVRVRAGRKEGACADFQLGIPMLPPQDPRAIRAKEDSRGCR